LYLFALGCVLAALCAFFGSLLNPPAIARWENQTRELDETRALLAMIGIRHLPIFLFCVMAGNAIFTMLKNTTWIAVLVVSTPYLIYAFVTAILESLEVGEPAFSWMGYEPSYFIWPHFVFVPAGLMASSRMVRQRKIRRSS
jgi:undecaprenyl pyrophosphate phosphatase UppP